MIQHFSKKKKNQDCICFEMVSLSQWYNYFGGSFLHLLSPFFIFD
jgi:hypothetical protein